MADLDTFLLRGAALKRINPRTYPLDWSLILRRALSAPTTGEPGAAQWRYEIISVLIGDGALIVATDRDLRRAWRRDDPCGVIERVEIIDDGDRVIVAAVPISRDTTAQELKVYVSSLSMMTRIRSIVSLIT